jgi:ferredoxin-fold anticodon binding domain-containing protein
MKIQELLQYKDQHGRLIYTSKLGFKNTLFGYIREVNDDHVVFQDNEKPDKFKIKNIDSFLPMQLTNIK